MIKLIDILNEARVTPIGIGDAKGIFNVETDEEGYEYPYIDEDRLYKILSKHFPKDVLDENFDSYIHDTTDGTDNEKYKNITKAKEWIDDFADYVEHYGHIDLEEARVVPDIGGGGKSKIFDTLYDKQPQILGRLIEYDTLKDLIEDFYEMDDTPITLEDVENYLIDDWQFDEGSEELKETTKLIEDYYKFIKPGDIKYVKEYKQKVSGYECVRYICLPGYDDDECHILLTKF